MYDWVDAAIGKAGECRRPGGGRGQRCHGPDGRFSSSDSASNPSSDPVSQSERTAQAARRHADSKPTSEGQRVSSDTSRMAEKALVQSGVFVKSTLPVRGTPIFKQTSELLNPTLIGSPENFADTFGEVLRNIKMTESFSTGYEELDDQDAESRRESLSRMMISQITALMRQPVTSGSERYRNMQLAEKVINDNVFALYARKYGDSVGLDEDTYRNVSEFFSKRVGDAGINQTAHEIAAQFDGKLSAGDIVGAIHNARGVFGDAKVSFGSADGLDAAVCVGLLFGVSEFLSRGMVTNQLEMDIAEFQLRLSATHKRSVDLLSTGVFTDNLKKKLLARHASMWSDSETDAFKHGMADALIKSGLSKECATEISDFTSSSLAQGDAVDHVLKLAHWSSLHALKNQTPAVWDSSRRQQEGIKTVAPGLESTHDDYFEDALSKGWSLAKDIRAIDHRGINTTYVCSFGGDRPFEAIMKLSNIGIGVSTNERLAYDVDKVLDFGVVPPTACIGAFSLQLHVKSLTGDKGSLMSIGRLRLQDKAEYQMTVNRPDNEWIQRINAFDFIMANPDRHRGNVFMHDKNRFFAIDNGILGSVTNTDRGLYKRVANRPISKTLLRKLDGVDTNRFYRTLIRGGMSDDNAKKCIQRLNNLRQTGMFPVVPSSDNDPTQDDISSDDEPTRPPRMSAFPTR